MITKTMDFEYCNTCIKMVNKIDGVCLQCKTMDGEEYIKKSDAKKLASELSGIPIKFLHKFDDLPTINLSVIDEMIEELTYTGAGLLEINARNTLKELKQRLSITK